MELSPVELQEKTQAMEFQFSEIDNLDFGLLKRKLQDIEDGEGWTSRECEQAELLYKRFLKLICLFPNQKLVPSKVIDTFWHYHILDTRHYLKSTERIFGEYIHHYPYLGLSDSADRNILNELYCQTLRLYRHTFNEDLSDSDFSKCDSDGGGESTCAGRCYKY